MVSRLLIYALLFLLPTLAPGQTARQDSLRAGLDWLAAQKFEFALPALRFAAGPTGTTDTLAARALHEIGVLHYSNYADSLALAAWEEALAIRERALPANHPDVARTRSNIAKVLVYFGDYDATLEHLHAAIAIYSAAAPSDTTNWLRSLSQITDVGVATNNYQVAMNGAEAAVRLLEETALLPEYDREVAEFNAALAYQTFNRPDKAVALAKSALRRAEASGSAENIAQNGNLLASVYFEEEAYQQAISVAQTALAVATAAADRGGLRLIIARSYLALGQPAAAAKYFPAVERDFTGQPDYLATLYAARGKWAALRQDTSAARAYYQAGLSFYPITDATDLSLPNLDSLRVDQYDQVIPLLVGAARCAPDLTAALAYYDHLFDLVDLMRHNSYLAENQMFLSTTFRKHFDRAIVLYGRRYEATDDDDYLWEAFLLSERAKAYSLLAALRGGQRARSDREIELRRNIAVLERADSVANSRQLAQLKLQLSNLLRERERNGRNIVVTSRETIEEHLARGNGRLLAFHVGEDEGAAWSIHSDGGKPTIAWWRIREVDSLQVHVGRFNRAIAESAYAGNTLRPAAERDSLDSEFLMTGQRLRDQLFPSPTTTPGTELTTIIPDGPLTVLPFNCLSFSSVSQPVDYGQIRYRFGGALRYAYSLGVLEACEQTNEAAFAYDLLALSPTFSGPANAVNKTRYSALPPLTYNREEANRIAELTDQVTLLTEEAATREAFLHFAARARVLHLSTHGMVDTYEPARSFIAFTQTEDSLDPAELLFFNDLTGLDIPADLVVLSACETSLGRYVPGNHAMSMSSAFTAAGARSTLTSLWRVNDRATMQLMVFFYEGLAAGLTRSEALAGAQQRMRETRYQHPYYWAAFTLYGADEPLDYFADSGDVDWRSGLIFGVILLTLIAGAFFGLRGRRRTQTPHDLPHQTP